MSEWYASQKRSCKNLRKFLQEHIEKSNPCGKLTAEEQKRLTKLETIADKQKAWRKRAKSSSRNMA